ncbi:MAG TPA: hypothetical protein VK817_19460, partial [Trebonia sp.]|nr:hypothetical protein [Trebonia sp.]
MALGLGIGAAVVFTGGGHSDNISQVALGSSASPSAAPSSGASTNPSPSATSSTPATTTTAANVNCDIIVPANPLTAKGLATPYQLTGPGGMTPA